MSDCLFARKFINGVSDNLIRLIDEYLLRDNEIAVSPTGCCEYNGYIKYKFDEPFMRSLLFLCRSANINSAIDFGCGSGLYVAMLREKGISASENEIISYFEQNGFNFNDGPSLIMRQQIKSDSDNKYYLFTKI